MITFILIKFAEFISLAYYWVVNFIIEFYNFGMKSSIDFK